jgi:hypothetical protein
LLYPSVGQLPTPPVEHRFLTVTWEVIKRAESKAARQFEQKDYLSHVSVHYIVGRDIYDKDKEIRRICISVEMTRSEIRVILDE